MDSIGDEEEPTTLLDRSGMSRPVLAAPLPAAGRPASIPPPRASVPAPRGSIPAPRASVPPPRASGSVGSLSGSLRPPPSVRPPPPSSARPYGAVDSNMPRATLRKVATSAPPALGLQAPPSSLSVDHVRRAALESARPNRSRPVDAAPLGGTPEAHLGSGGSLRSLERSVLPVQSTSPSKGASTFPPPGTVRVREIEVGSESSPPSSFGRSRRHGSSTSVPGVSMSSGPAHFRRPHAPFGDPPGTAVTSSRFARPARSWAAMLVGCGVFVAVVGAAMVRAGEPAAEGAAAFIDPSRTGGEKAAAASPQAATNEAPPPPVAKAAEQAPEPTPAATALAANPAPPVAAVPSFVVAATPSVAPSPATPPVTSPPVVVASAPPKAAAPVRPAAPAWHPPPAPAPKPVAKPVEEEPVVAKKSTPAPSRKSSSAGKSSETDDETKKALEELRKAQLESSF